MPILTNTPDASEEATMVQLDYIVQLVERKRVSARCATNVIRQLQEEPDLNPSGGSNKEITELVRQRIERDRP